MILVPELAHVIGTDTCLKIPAVGKHVRRLRRQSPGQRILESEVGTIGARGLVVELKSLQAKAIGQHCGGIKGNATKTRFKGRSSAWTCATSASGLSRPVSGERGIDAHRVHRAVRTLRNEIEVE